MMSNQTSSFSAVQPQGRDGAASEATAPQTEKHLSPYQFNWIDWFCLWYPPGWLILFNRHWQHYHDDPDGWNAIEYLLFLIPFGFYLALLIRWLRLGCRAPQNYAIQVDPNYQDAFQQEVLAPILKHYFRAELHQIEALPQEAPLVVVMNHAGMCFPWDFLGLGVLLRQHRNWFVRPVAHPIFFNHPWLKWWLPTGWSHIMGGVEADRESFEQAIATGNDQLVLLYAPEGWRGLVKGWRARHQLQTFDPSFVRLSDRYRVPILPVTCIGNEYLHPWTINIKWLARWTGLPIFPLSPLILVFILFPSMGVWANRTRLRYFLQPLEKLWETSESLQERSPAYQKAQALRMHLQSAVDQQLTQLGVSYNS